MPDERVQKGSSYSAFGGSSTKLLALTGVSGVQAAAAGPVLSVVAGVGGS